MTCLRIVVHGTPAPQGSKKAFVNKKTGRAQVVDDNKDTLRTWRQAVTWAALDAVDLKTFTPFDGPVTLHLTLIFNRPKNHYGTGRNAARLKPTAPYWVVTKPDIDKCQRAIFDALTDAGIWRDDNQAVHVLARKRYADTDETASAVIELRPIIPERAA